MSDRFAAFFSPPLKSRQIFLRVFSATFALICSVTTYAVAQSNSGVILDPQQKLQQQTFWDNRDWDWYRDQIPFFECPDADLETTYYYRWELLTKHLTYGSPRSGYSFTEFIDRPFWSGAYGAISCPAGHQLYEARWLRNPQIARDYGRYWYRTPGAQPRNYSTWLVDSLWATHLVHPDREYLTTLLPEMVKNHEGWQQRHFVPAVGLYWQTGHDDGMEFNINSRQTQDILRGAPSYRPSFNAYMWADAMAIARVADLAGQPEIAQKFRAHADQIKERMQALLWDPKRQFFFPMYRDDEHRDGHQVKANTLTYQSGQFAGDPHGRELIGYVPWQFNLLDTNRGYEVAWKKLTDHDAFDAPFGPTTVERHDPMFLLKDSCCWWSGQSWPYATSQTLKALANLLQSDQRAKSPLSPEDYANLLIKFAKTHRKDGKPYLAEACHPDTGSFKGHDGYNHSEHYFHSSFVDLVISGLVGIIPQENNRLVLHPLVPAAWDYFALQDVPYQGHLLTIAWDRQGTRYGKGKGLHVIVDGQAIAHTDQLERLEISLPNKSAQFAEVSQQPVANYCVNNDGDYFPRVTATYTAPETSIQKLNDGNYWYHRHPPNRWACTGSPNDRDSLVIDLGMPRMLQTIKLYFLDDRDTPFMKETQVAPPQRVTVEGFSQGKWETIQELTSPAGRRPAVISFAARPLEKLRCSFEHATGSKTGLTEVEAWGPLADDYAPASPPQNNLATTAKASASHTSRFDQVTSANDGIVNFQPNPNNRWTSYESKNESDWLQLDFGRKQSFNRVELAIYDDHGGVQAPESYTIEYFDGAKWVTVEEEKRQPANPIGGQWNESRFKPIESDKLRIVFKHRGLARTGVSEVLVWND